MIRQDLRHAVRVHLKHPFLAATVVGTLALGLGANTAIFHLVDGILLQPLPYPDSGRLVRLYQTYESLRSSPNPRLRAIWNRLPVSYLNTVEYRQESRTLAAIGLYSEYSATFLDGDEPETIEAAAVDSALFEALGVEPVLGRTFEPEEVERRERRVVLSHELWQRLYGGDPNVLDRKPRLDGEPYTVLGVMPAGFDIAGGSGDRLWTPLRLTDDDLARRDNQRLHALARLAPGVSLEELEREIGDLSRKLAGSFPETNQGTGVRAVPLLETVVAASRPLLTLLMASVAVVLVIACVNVAHLLLSQTGRRRGELAIRRALGASRRRLTSQLLVESLVLALLGGALGFLLALRGRHLLLGWIPADLPRTGDLGVDGRLLAFTLGTSLAAALLCGLLPAWTGSATSSVQNLRGGQFQDHRGAGFLTHSFLTHNGFVVAQIALALMLTAGAGLLVNSFLRLSVVEAGFRTDGLLVQEIRLPLWSYPDEARRQDFARRSLERLAALPGVSSAAYTSKLPFAGPALVAGLRIPGADDGEQDWTLGQSAALKFVTGAYFETLGIPVLSGRALTDADRPERGRVLVVNRTLAERTWGGEDPVGRTVLMGTGDESYTVVGVVGDIRHDGVASDGGALMYQPWSQRHDTPFSAALTAVLDVGRDPLSRAPEVRRLLRELDPSLAVPVPTTVERLMNESLGAPRSRAVLMTLLAALALFLALIGTYAVLSFTVGRRVREIGIRMALGASAARVRSLVLRRTLALAALGIALGTLGTFYGSRLLEGLLYGVEAADPVTFTAAAALLAVTAVLAGFFPSLRASRIDPAVALRNE